jgi:hypothetical protein
MTPTSKPTLKATTTAEVAAATRVDVRERSTGRFYGQSTDRSVA